jgi:hypothetical protein
MFMILRRLKWPLIFLFYDILIYWKPIPAVIVLAALMLAAYQAYQVDLGREHAASDDFRGDGLFYRYGWKATYGVWPVPVKPEWSTQQIEAFVVSLRRKLADRIHLRLPDESVQVLEPVTIEDKQRGIRKEFVRTLARTKIGSMVTHFIYVDSFGRSLTLRYDSFVRGVYTWFDLAKFIAQSPLTIWFWIVPWSRNAHSIVSRLSNFSDNSFDGIDVATIFTMTHHLVLEEISLLLEEEGVLTPELRQMIMQQITNVQNFSVTGSSGVMIGPVSQANSTPAPKAA